MSKNCAYRDEKRVPPTELRINTYNVIQLQKFAPTNLTFWCPFITAIIVNIKYDRTKRSL